MTFQGSGDTYESYDVLSFEVYLSISSSNVGVAWTHDLGEQSEA